MVADDALGATVLGEFPQAACERLRGRRRHCQAVIVLLALGARRVREVVVVSEVDAVDPVRIRACQRLERRLAARADEQRWAHTGRTRGAALFGGRGFTQNSMRVRATESERVDAHDDSGSVVGERRVLGSDLKIEIGERNIGIRGTKMQRSRDCPVLERQHHLDQPREARARFQVADVGLDRADQQRTAAVTTRGKRPSDGTGLLRVTRRGTGPVRLEVSDVGGINTGLVVYGAQQRLLGRRARQRHSVRVSIGIDARAQDDRMHMVAIGPGSRQGLQEQDHATLRPHVPVGRGIEGAAAAGRRKHRSAREAYEREGTQQNVDAAHESRGRLAAADALACLV